MVGNSFIVRFLKSENLRLFGVKKEVGQPKKKFRLTLQNPNESKLQAHSAN